MMQLVAAIEKEVNGQKKSFWTKIGVAFQNKDGSWNLRFDFFPTNLVNTTVQMRERDRETPE